MPRGGEAPVSPLVRPRVLRACPITAMVVALGLRNAAIWTRPMRFAFTDADTRAEGGVWAALARGTVDLSRAPGGLTTPAARAHRRGRVGARRCAQQAAHSLPEVPAKLGWRAHGVAAITAGIRGPA